MKNRLLRIAVIVDFAIFLVIAIPIALENDWAQTLEIFNIEPLAVVITAIFGFIIFFVGWILPAIFNNFAVKNNNKVLILVAGILYLFTIVGIPSAILCFIVFSKLKQKNG